MNIPFTLAQLEYVVALDTHRHFVTAAEKCFVPQPTLSAQIKKMEHILGAELFDRSKQPVIPTDIGMEVIAHAREILRVAADISTTVEFQKGKEKFIIPGDDLKALRFQLKALPDGGTPKEGELFGGSWMKIPTQRGSFDCELQLDTPEKKQDLLNMIEFLKIEHDVAIEEVEEHN